MRATQTAVGRERYEGKGSAGCFYLGNAPRVLEEMARSEGGAIKLVYMDPPFLTGEQFVMRARMGAAQWKAGKGSLVLPAFSDDLAPQEYYAMMRSVLESCRALLSEDGMLFLHCDFRTSARLRLLMDEVFGEKNLLNEIVWAYHTGGYGAALFQPQARHHPFLPQNAPVRFQYFRRAARACGTETKPHAPPCGPGRPRLPLHPFRGEGVYLL